jgi:hypothetical protein
MKHYHGKSMKKPGAEAGLKVLCLVWPIIRLRFQFLGPLGIPPGHVNLVA